MKTGVILYSNNPETAWNAFRYANFAVKAGDQAKVFLMGGGAEAESLDAQSFPVAARMKDFTAAGGQIPACGTCLKPRGSSPTAICPLESLKDMRSLVRESDRILTF